MSSVAESRATVALLVLPLSPPIYPYVYIYIYMHVYISMYPSPPLVLVSSSLPFLHTLV